MFKEVIAIISDFAWANYITDKGKLIGLEFIKIRIDTSWIYKLFFLYKHEKDKL